MKIKTSRFGEIETDGQAAIAVPGGLIGFPHATRYLLLDHDHAAPFKWLQAVDDGTLAFVVMDPLLIQADYRVPARPETLELLEVREGDEIAVMVILTIPPHEPSRVTANLRGPIVVNMRTKRAAQLILPEDLPVRHPVFPVPTEPSSAPCAAAR
jgi:flagellar assembly factor FliW